MSAFRVLFITGEYPPMQGGVADYTRALSRALVARGYTIGVLTHAHAQACPDDDGITVWPGVTRWDWSLWAQIDRTIETWAPDIVHIQYQTAAYAMHPAINLWSWRPWHRPPTPTAVTFHDLRQPYLFPKAHLVRRWVTDSLARHQPLTITTNPEDSAALRARGHEVLEIPIGSNIPCAPPPDWDLVTWRQQHGLPADAVVICYFGFLNASKGGEILVDVLQRCHDHDIAAHLLMIGGRVGASDPTNYAYLQKVEARIAATGLEAWVHWTGHLPSPQVSAAFLASDLCLLPYEDGVSYRRGSFMAALAHGMPIVTTTPVVPYPDLESPQTVLLAAPGDVTALTALVEDVLNHPQKRQNLAENAHRLAARFEWDGIAEASDAAYRSILGS